MTTIAFDGKSIVADTQCTYGSHRQVTFDKMRIIKGVVYAVSGDIYAAAKFFEFLETGKSHALTADESDFRALAVHPDGRCIKYKQLEIGTEVVPPQAIGSGDEIALTAIHLGLNAVEAVHVASQMDVYTSMPLMVVNVGDTDIQLVSEVTKGLHASDGVDRSTTKQGAPPFWGAGVGAVQPTRSDFSKSKFTSISKIETDFKISPKNQKEPPGFDQVREAVDSYLQSLPVEIFVTGCNPFSNEIIFPKFQVCDVCGDKHYGCENCGRGFACFICRREHDACGDGVDSQSPGGSWYHILCHHNLGSSKFK